MPYEVVHLKEATTTAGIDMSEVLDFKAGDAGFVKKLHDGAYVKKDGKLYEVSATATGTGKTYDIITAAPEAYKGYAGPGKKSMVLVDEKEPAYNVLYFTYDRLKYTLTIHADKGIDGSTVKVGDDYEGKINPDGDTVIGKIYYGTEINLDITPEEGYRYEITGDSDSGDFAMPDHDAEIWIKTTESQYTVELESNGGTFGYGQDRKTISTDASEPAPTELSYTHGYNDDWTLPWADKSNQTKAKNPDIRNQERPVVTRDGYAFMGWSLRPVDPASLVSDPAGYEADFKDASEISYKDKDFKQKVKGLSDKYKGTDGVKLDFASDRGEVRLYAVWCPVRYVVRYHGSTVAEDGTISGVSGTYIDDNGGKLYTDDFRTGTYSAVTMPTNASGEALGGALRGAFGMADTDDFCSFRIAVPKAGAARDEDDAFWADSGKVERNLTKDGMRRIKGWTGLAIGVTTTHADAVTNADGREEQRGTWGCPYGLAEYIGSTAYVKYNGKYIDVGVVDVYTDYTEAVTVTWDGNPEFLGPAHTRKDVCHYGESVAFPDGEFEKLTINTLEGWDMSRTAIFKKGSDGSIEVDGNGNKLRDASLVKHRKGEGGSISYAALSAEFQGLSGTYYAQWTAKTYEIHYYPGQVAGKSANYTSPNGITATYSSTMYYSQTVTSEVTRLVKERYNDNAESNRYQFMGWNIDGSGGTYGYSSTVNDIPIVVSGYYTFEVAGASGGCDGHMNIHSGDTGTYYEPTDPGEGGITRGTIYLKAGDTVHIAAGSSGINDTTYNGGKNASTEYNVSGGGAGGFGTSGSGGAGSVVYSDNEGLIMVAGGGGGSGHKTTGDSGNSSYYVEGQGWYGQGRRVRYKYLQAYDACTSYDSPNDGGNRPWYTYEGGGGGGGYYGGDRKDLDDHGNGNDTGAYGGAGYVNKNVINYSFSTRTAGSNYNWKGVTYPAGTYHGGWYSHETGRRYTTTGWGVIDYDETTGYYPANGYVKMSEVAIADQEKVLVSDKTESLGLTDAVQLYAKNGVVKLTAKWGKASPMFSLKVTNIADDMMKYYDDLGYSLTDYDKGYELATKLDKDISLPDLSLDKKGNQIHDGFLGWQYTDRMTGESKVERTVTIPKGSSGYYEYRALWADHYAASVWGIDHDYNIYGVDNTENYTKPAYDKSKVEFQASAASNSGVTFGAALGYDAKDSEGLTGVYTDANGNRAIAENDFDKKYVDHEPSEGKGCIHRDYISGGWKLIRDNMSRDNGRYYSECLEEGCTVPVFFWGNQMVASSPAGAEIMVNGETAPYTDREFTTSDKGYTVRRTALSGFIGKGDGCTAITGDDSAASWQVSGTPDDPLHYGGIGTNYKYEDYAHSNMPAAMDSIDKAILNPVLSKMIGDTDIVYATDSKDDTKGLDRFNAKNATWIAPATITDASKDMDQWWLDHINNSGYTGTIVDQRSGNQTGNKIAYRYGSTTGRLFLPSAREVYGDCTTFRGGNAYNNVTWGSTMQLDSAYVLDYLDGNQFEKFRSYSFLGSLWITESTWNTGAGLLPRDTSRLNNTSSVQTRTPGASNTKARTTAIDGDGRLNTTCYTYGSRGLAPCFRCRYYEP